MRPIRLLPTLLAISYIVFGQIAPASAKEFVFGLSPHLPVDTHEHVLKRLIQFVMFGTELGDRIIVANAHSNQRIAEFTIPKLAAYKRPEMRIDANREAFLAISRFMKGQTLRQGGGMISNLRVNIPQFLDYVAGNVIQTQNDYEVVLMGDPLYQDSREATFSMTGGLVPSDGHLNVTREKSVFGIKGKDQRLKGATVHIIYWGVEWASDLHRLRVNRFWSLFVGGQGGRLVTFDGDLMNAFSRIGKSLIPGSEKFELDLSEQKLEMVAIRREVEQRRINEMFERPVQARPPPQKGKGNIVVGIKWDCLECDLDLYARASQKGEWIHFAVSETLEGRFYKYAGEGTQPSQGLEYIEFKDERDLRDIAVAVDFYEGRRKAGPKGIVRLDIDGEVYEAEFQIKAETGNKGVDVRSLHNSDHWVVLKGEDVIRGRRTITRR